MRLAAVVTTACVALVACWSRGAMAFEHRVEQARFAGAALLPEDGVLRSRQAVSIQLPPCSMGQAYHVTVSLDEPERMGSREKLAVRVVRSGSPLINKSLHNGDPDLYCVVRAAAAGETTEVVVGDADSPTPPFLVSVAVYDAVQSRPNGTTGVGVVIETEPNDRPEDAVEFELGQPVFASADDRAYLIAPGDDEAAAKAAGADWFKFTFAGAEPALAFVTLNLIDREVPVDLAIFTVDEGTPRLYQPEFEKFEPEKTTRFAGMFKFIARRVEPGKTYYLRVNGNHPAYQLSSEVLPLPPYEPEREGNTRNAAEKSVRAALDYLLLKGDSWHANTPRVGGIDNRLQNLHAETAQCIACHPTHFTTRAAVFANENGYSINQRTSLQFLTERLYNNPRPFYGHPQAAWARMISASANVLSRLSIMLSLFEKNIAGYARTDMHRAVAEYLKLYYKERNEIPANETNGNLPLVSKFEVAEYSWMVFDELYRRTKEEDYASWARHVRTLVETADPAKHIQDMSDLCFQTTALCRMDRQGYADRIRVNVERLFSYQHPDGSWPMRFGEKELPADFQTGHCLFTLAFAGVSAEDPRVARGVRYLLSRQQPFGGWFDHDDPKKSNPYENFRTPFYESQFAVMALAQLYPSTTTVAKGWKGGTESEVSLASNDQWHTLLEQVEQIWDVGDSETTHGVVAALGHNNVLVREAAARCLARIGDAESVKPLLVALGDRSKMVRRAAAFALRDLGNRGLAKDTVADALRDENALARRGALRVFAQHFRYWIDAEDARRVIIDRLMCDIDPYIRMMACRTLWQWWQWDADESVRGAIEDKFIERMAVEDHPWVRSNLIEGFTNLCDENTRYLYNNWIALLGTTADREKATSGHHASGTRQGKKIAAALAAGSELQIQSLLQAIGYFHLRTGTYAAKGRFGRIGNDVEAVQFYAEVAPLLKRSLSPLVSSSKPEIRGPALLAAYSLRGTGSEDELGVPFLQGLADPDEFTRGVATELHASFPPPVNEATEPAVLDAIATLMSSNIPEARKAALEQIGKLKFSSDGRAVLSRSVMNYFAHADDDLLRQALIAVAGLPSLWTEPVVIKRVADAIQSKNKVHRQAAVRLAMMSDTLGGVTVIRSRLDSVFGSSDAAIRTSLLELAQTNEALLKHARVAHLVSDAMAGSAQAVRQLALDLVRRSVDLQSNAAVRAALAELLQDPNERTRQIAETLYSGTRLPRDVDVADLLDFEYFKRKVQPVFFAFGPDQKACVQCHHNHGILKLTAPPDGSPITDEISRDNYRSALRVVNLAAPEKSLILQKPLGSADVEGVVDAQAVSHGGEQRWPAGSASPEYQSILSWINGGRIEARP